MSTIPLTGFMPSADPTTAGAILDCSNLVPTLRGMRPAPSKNATGAVFSDTVTGAATCELLSGTFRTIVGTSEKLYEVIGSITPDVNDVSGTNVFSGGENRWRFCQFGNATIATNGTDPMVESINTGDFVRIGIVNNLRFSDYGSGYTAAPTVTFSGGTVGTPASTTLSLLNDQVDPYISNYVTNQGSQYARAPTVAISAPPGTVATFSNTVNSSGQLTAVTVVSGGSGYSANFPLTITSNTGVNAVAIAQVSGGVVTSVNVTAEGSGYVSGSTTVTAPAKRAAVATAVMDYAPAAYIIEVTQGFVFAFDTTDPDRGHVPNGWWCSALYNQDSWLPSQSTQAEYGQIIDTPGKITAARALSTNIVVYKRESMYYGTYQGAPTIWAFTPISPIVGTPCQEAVVLVGTTQIFLGSDGQVYSYDGSTLTPIGDDVKDWLFENWSAKYRDRVESYHDTENSLIYWYFCSRNADSATPDTCLVYNYRKQKFGRADQTIEAAVSYISGQITWDDLGSLPNVTTWNTLPVIQYNNSYWVASNQAPAIIDTEHKLYSFSGVPGSSSLTTNWFGDDAQYSYLQGIVPRFTLVPATCTGTASYVSQLGQAVPSNTALGDMYDGELAADYSCRYTQVTLNFTGNYEILGAVPRVISAGAI